MKSLKEVVGRFKIFITLVIFFLIISTGCAKNAVKNISDEGILRERIMLYWDHKVKQEFDKCYEYENPLFRKKINLVNYIKGFNTGKAKWSDAMIEDLAIDGENATAGMKVRIDITVSSSGHLEQDVLINEKWIKVDGMWYHIPQKQK